MRLDKYVSQTTGLTRTLAKRAVLKSQVKVNSLIVSEPKFQVKASDKVQLLGKELNLEGKRYILLYKPVGYICSSQDEVYPSALNLLPKSITTNLHFAGRLDVDTTGLVLISDDGQWSHRVTSPRRKCTKVYRVNTANEINCSQIENLCQGVFLKGEDKVTQPAEVELINAHEINLTLHEGRYHQVKRMLAAVGNHVVSLHRSQVGELDLKGLEEGRWRNLTPAEVALF